MKTALRDVCPRTISDTNCLPYVRHLFAVSGLHVASASD